MALISVYKVVSSVPASLDSNALYLVRTGTGFDFYVSDSTGSVAYQINSSGAGGGLSNIVEDTTPQLGGDLDLNGNDITGTGNISITGEVEADIHIGSLRGEIQFKAKAGEALTKGDPVYISSYDTAGNTPIVAIADANDSAKMPCFGLANESVSLNASVNVVTFGTLSGLDTSGFGLGDTLYVSNTGTLTNSKPAGESSLIQNIGKVQRVDNSAGSIKVGGAGRTNDVPNLNQGNVFIGNASNQAETRGLTLDDIEETATNKHFTSGDESKLNGIESGATADQTDAEIKTAYENNANTNAFTDAEKTKLSGIAAGAEVNVNADWNATSGDAEILNKPTDVTDLTGHKAVDLIDINSAGSGSIITSSERTKLTGIESGATQNDTDANLKGRANHTGEQAISTVTGLQTALDGKVDDSQVLTNVPSNAVFTDTTYIVADNQLSEKNFTTALHTKLTGVEAGATADQTASEIKTAYESNADTNAFTNAEKSKLTGVETNANNYTLPAASGSLGGIVSGSGGDVTVDGSGVVTVLDDSHNHVISNVDGLQAALDAKVDDSQVLTNVPANAVFTDTTYSDATTSVSGLMSGADKTKLDGLTGAEVNVNADWSETDSNSDAFILNKPTTITGSEQAKLGHISVTQAVDLDTMESNIATNTAKVTNATHTGDVTGSTVLTITNDSVTNAKMANVATGTVKGRTSAGVGDVEDLEIASTLKPALNLTLDDSAETTTNKHFTATDQTKLSGIETGADVTDSTNVSAAGALMKSGGTMTGELQVNARLDVGDGSANDTEIRIYKNDNNVSDHLQFYNGTTRVGEIGVEDTSWLRINQETNKNIYTPRMIRADAGFQVDGNDVITGAGVHKGDGSDLTSLNASNISSGTLNTARLPASATFGGGISTDGSDVYTDGGAFISHDTNGDFADRTGTNIDHIWHDDNSNAWHLCSDTSYKATGNTKLVVGSIEASGNIKSGDSNSDVVIGEHSGYASYGAVFLDGESSYRLLMGPGSHTFLNALGSGHIYFRNDNATLAEINDQGEIIGYGNFRCSGQAEVNGATRYNNVAFNSRAIGSASNDFMYYGQDNSGAGRFSVRSSDGTVWSSSDKRWKKNIESLSGILNRVCQCVLSKFHFKKQEDTELKSIGFISQEIEPIFPELVEDLPDGYKAINYDRFGAIAFQAIKELREEKDAQIKKLEARIETLEAKL